MSAASEPNEWGRGGEAPEDKAMHEARATCEELEKIGQDLKRQGRIVDYVVEETQSGQCRLLVRDHGAKDFAPLEPAD